MILSSQEEAPSPITTISSLLQHQALRASSRHGRCPDARSSLSSVLQRQTQSRSMSGSAPSHQTTSLPVFPPNLDEYPRSKRITLTPGGGSQTAQKIVNYLPIYTHENITWNDWNSNDYDYQGAYNLNPQKMCFWYIIAKPADGATTSQIFMQSKLTFYTELNERNQEVDFS